MSTPLRERWKGAKPPWILKFTAKKVAFLVLRGKIKFHHFWPPLEKFRKNPLVPPPGKNPSDALKKKTAP